MPIEEVILTNNIFGTLFMASLYMRLLDLAKKGITEKKTGKVLLAIGGFLLSLLIGIALLMALNSENRIAAMILLFIPNPISVEGGFSLILLGLLFYILRKYRLAQAALIVVTSILSWLTLHNAQWLMVFAVIPILLYNGQRGRGSKYFFYIFYPAHIYIFYIIAWFIG
jgi:magnesium-transporting ATPase (P-type)